MRLGGSASFVAEINQKSEIADVMNFAREHQLKTFVLGEGSNTLANDDGFEGIILHMKIKGFKLINEDYESVTIQFGAGNILDEIVAESCRHNLSGIEAMSMIPGTIGAAPVQNVGAYGQDISQTFVELEAYDTIENCFVTLDKNDCEFSYRMSIFRGKAWRRYIICSVTLRLRKGNPRPPFYKLVEEVLRERGLTQYTPQMIRDAVMDIRKWKLPDPNLIPNSGSFFKNAMIDQNKLEELRSSYPHLKAFYMGNGKYKISTGWLIEQAGLKGVLMHGMQVYDRNALVLTNISAYSYESLAQAREEIMKKVEDIFGITIVQEVLEIE